MSTKRKQIDGRDGRGERPEKKAKQEAARQEKARLVFQPRPEWHTVPLPPLELQEVKHLPPQRTVDELHAYATGLLEAENASYNAGHLAGSSSHKFLSTIMSSGTLEDKVSALTLLVQESPLHTMKALENLVNLAKKRSRNQALMAVAALKDLLGQGVVLPGDRKLRAFGKQPGLLAALQGKAAKWSAGDELPTGVANEHLILWAYEDWLKRTFFELLQVLENWCNDEVEYARSRAITYVFELLRDKPEQEENLLRLLVNKLGDTDKKIASRASYLLLQLQNTHPAMKMTITNSIESDCLFRPGQSLHAKYYAIITLNQTILSQKEEPLANRVLEIYFALFVQFLRPNDSPKPDSTAPPKPSQGGGGKAGRAAAKKRKAAERSQEAELQTRDKLLSQVLTGVNRAFPFADTNSAEFEQQMDTIFRVAHSANFNTAIQALVLIQQISTTKHYGAERFYRTLYESLLDPRLFGSSKQVMYLNLLYKALKADVNAKRVVAFVKRLLQIAGMHDPPFACGVLYLISELEGSFQSIRNMITEPELGAEDEEEHFVDADTAGSPPPATANTHKSDAYDPRKRDPTHSHADRSALWDLLPLLPHYHPSVSLFATSILSGRKNALQKPDPTQHTLMHFLDRFVYRNPKTKQNLAKGGSIMQPLLAAQAGAADSLLSAKGAAAGGGERAPVNSESFWRRKVEDVGAEEVFFHQYFTATQGAKDRKGTKKEEGAKGKQRRDVEAERGGADAAEEEIWRAIAQSRPEVEGDDGDDDDLSFGDLEDASDASDDDGSEAGIDLGGGAEADESANLEDTFAEMDGFALESDEDDAILDSDEEPAVDLDADESEEEEEEEESQSKRRRKQKKKLKALPTFASVDDYAKLLAEEPDEEFD